MWNVLKHFGIRQQWKSDERGLLVSHTHTPSQRVKEDNLNSATEETSSLNVITDIANGKAGIQEEEEEKLERRQEQEREIETQEGNINMYVYICYT